MREPTIVVTNPLVSLTRTIHPVGQGAFYSETFKDENNTPLSAVVYDCGGKLECVKKEIQYIPIVNYLFISHFHADHINCVIELLSNSTVQNVVFPRITPARFLVDFVRNSMRDTIGDSRDFMLKILPIMKSGQSGRLSDGSSTIYIPETGSDRFPFLKEKPIWEYISFCEETDDSQERRLLEKLKTVLKLPDNYFEEYQTDDFYNQVPNLLKDNNTLEKVKDAYSKVFTNGHNSYSMPVLSQRIKLTTPEDDPFDCLYTGDCEGTTWLINLVTKNNPAFIQVPHHGSIHNHNIDIYTNAPTAFISVGERNQYRHPGLVTYLDLVEKCKEVWIITENRKVSVKKHLVTIINK